MSNYSPFLGALCPGCGELFLFRLVRVRFYKLQVASEIGVHKRRSIDLCPDHVTVPSNLHHNSNFMKS